MTINKNQLRLLWVAAGKLGLSETALRSTVAQIGGVDSTKELDREGFEALLGYFEYLGFAPVQPRGQNYGHRPGMASFAQIELIRTLWHEYTRGKSDEGELGKWLERCWRVSSLRFLKAQTAPKVITALKAMKARAA